MVISKKQYVRIRFLVAVLAVGFAAVAIYTFLTIDVGQFDVWPKLYIVIWSIVPPVYFYCEYLLLDSKVVKIKEDCDDEICLNERLESNKIYADFASKVWAGVLAIIVILASIALR